MTETLAAAAEQIAAPRACDDHRHQTLAFNYQFLRRAG